MDIGFCTVFSINWEKFVRRIVFHRTMDSLKNGEVVKLENILYVVIN